jgi:hypothetical protein
MRRTLFIFGLVAWLAGPGLKRVSAQIQPVADLPAAPVARGSAPAASAGASAQVLDGIAARIEDDIITESEVRELGAFQLLVEGSAKPRIEIIQQLANQWIVHGEAALVAYPPPSKEDVDRAYAEFVKQFSSAQEFQSRCVTVGLSEFAVRRIIEQQLFLSHFVDYRFRPAAQVDEKQIEAYFNDEFAPQLKAKNQPVPPLEDVEDTIREVLIQRAITDRATKWLDDTRDHLKIDVVAQGAGP